MFSSGSPWYCQKLHGFVKLFIYFFTSIGKNMFSLDRSFTPVPPAKSSAGRIPGTPSSWAVLGREQGPSVYTQEDPYTAHGRRDGCTLIEQSKCVCVCCAHNMGEVLREKSPPFSQVNYYGHMFRFVLLYVTELMG